MPSPAPATPPPIAAVPRVPVDPRPASPSPDLTRYRDPRGLFNIEYPAGWQVRTAAPDSTTFYLDDPEDGIAVTVLAQGAVPGQLDAPALTATVTRRMRERYPDFALTTVATRTSAGGRQHSQFSARWTNRWAQPMRARGVIVTAPRGADTAYSLVMGQAQELVFAALEPVFSRVLDSFRASFGG